MTHSLHIATIEDGEIEPVVALWQRCGLIVPWNDPHKDIAFARAAPNSDVLIGRLDNRIVAAVVVGHDGHRGNVYYVSVDPNLQGQGLGRAIMDAAANWLRRRGVWKLNIMVRGTNRKVISFYERWGAEQEDRAVLSYWLAPRPDISSE